jgi:hypothetical protein
LGVKCSAWRHGAAYYRVRVQGNSTLFGLSAITPNVSLSGA